MTMEHQLKLLISDACQALQRFDTDLRIEISKRIGMVNGQARLCADFKVGQLQDDFSERHYEFTLIVGPTTNVTERRAICDRIMLEVPKHLTRRY